MSERSKVGDEFYRYRDPWGEDGVDLPLEILYVKRLTRAGYWLADVPHGEVSKFVLHDARRRYAYPTKEPALRSYIVRKCWQLRHLAAAKGKAERGLYIAEELQAGREPKAKSGGLFDFFEGES